jgi:broad specificity phosphatase PhoE
VVTRLILVRHADSRHKAAGVTGGPRSCTGLTDAGRDQAARLRARLARDFAGGEPPAAVYASVLPRAVETAEIAGAAFGSPEVRQDCGLCTWHIPPEWDGLTWDQVRWRHSAEGGGVYRPFEHGAESWAELVARVGRALYGIAQRHRGGTALVFTHKEVVEASLIVFGALPLMLPFEGRVENTSLTEWTTDGDPAAFPHPRWTLERFNDAAHLT